MPKKKKDKGTGENVPSHPLETRVKITGVFALDSPFLLCPENLRIYNTVWSLILAVVHRWPCLVLFSTETSLDSSARDRDQAKDRAANLPRERINTVGLGCLTGLSRFR